MAGSVIVFPNETYYEHTRLFIDGTDKGPNIKWKEYGKVINGLCNTFKSFGMTVSIVRTEIDGTVRIFFCDEADDDLIISIVNSFGLNCGTLGGYED